MSSAADPTRRDSGTRGPDIPSGSDSLQGKPATGAPGEGTLEPETSSTAGQSPPTESLSPADSTRRREVRFEYTPEFPRVLEQLHAALLVSTYQAGKLCVVGVQDGRLTFSFHSLERVMGVAASPGRVAVRARRQSYSYY